MSTTRLALVQFEAKLCDTVANTKKACDMIAEAGKNGADLVILPELFSTGYELNIVGPHIAEMAETTDGPTVSALCKAARDAHCYVVAGIALVYELTGVVYNSAVVIDREGNLLGTYDKQHLWALERYYFRTGNHTPVFDTDFGRIGIMICYDMGFPEVARMLTLQGADLLICPSAWCAQDMDVWNINAPARALENSCYLAAVNRYGVEDQLVMPGHSMVCNPRGHVIDHLEEEAEGILYSDIDLGTVSDFRQVSPYLRDRRPDLYDIVTRH